MERHPYRRDRRAHPGGDRRRPAGHQRPLQRFDPDHDHRLDDVIGFAAYGPFRDDEKWPGYRFTAEHTVHVDEAWHGRGVGRRLVEGLLAHARDRGLHVMVAGVDGANEGSIRFHERLGFEVVARMPETGYKFARWLDLVLLQRTL